VLKSLSTPHVQTANPETLDALIRINSKDFIEALGLSHVRTGRALLMAMVRPTAIRFAQQVMLFDHKVAAEGLPAAGQWVVNEFAQSYRVTGWRAEHAHGPALIVSNHPGLTDALALFASIGRADLRIIARHRDFLEAMPNMSRHLIYVPDVDKDVHNTRFLSIRRVATVLREGHAVLTFPAGKIEPDPAVMPGAAQSLTTWSESIGLFTRLVPEMQVIPVIVSGVISPTALRSPLARIRRARKDREWLAATLQIVFMRYRNTPVHTHFGPPMLARDLAAQYGGAAAITHAIIQRAKTLLPSVHQ
jgi:1-acyl-sn-glycerol-3-phosphate acyltransferase